MYVFKVYINYPFKKKKFIRIEKAIKIINHFFIKYFLKYFTFFRTYVSISLTKKNP